MGGALSPLLANIYVEYVETLAIDTYFFKPKFWGRYVFVIWNYGESQIEGFLEHLNNLGRELVFTIENETENKLPFLDIWIHRKNNELVFFQFTVNQLITTAIFLSHQITQSK